MRLRHSSLPSSRMRWLKQSRTNMWSSLSVDKWRGSLTSVNVDRTCPLTSTSLIYTHTHSRQQHILKSSNCENTTIKWAAIWRFNVGLPARSVVNDARDALPSSIVPLSRGRGTRAPGTRWAWSCRSRPTRRYLWYQSPGVRGGDSGHGFATVFIRRMLAKCNIVQ